MIRRLPLLWLCTALALAACSSDGSDSGGSENGDEAVTTTATGDGATTTSTAASGRLIVSGDGSRALVSLVKLRNEIYFEPDPARVDNYLSPECPCYQAERDALTELQQNGWKWITPVLNVVGVRIDEDSPDRAALTIVATRPAERVEESAGVLARPVGPGLAPTGFRAVVGRRSSAWKLLEFTPAELSQEAIDALIREGVPAS
ncbi:MAG TPA: hypothetical protein VI854_03720 [Acidimicrobiia bacterium]|nr:hypothetical protein [Acidimicrobiia bacterium]